MDLCSSCGRTLSTAMGAGEPEGDSEAEGGDAVEEKGEDWCFADGD